MAYTSREIRAALNNARTMPVHEFHGVTLDQAKADRAAAIADLEKDLAERESEAGSE